MRPTAQVSGIGSLSLLHMNLLYFITLLRSETPKRVLWQTLFDKTKSIYREGGQFYKETLNCNSSIHTMGHPDLIVCSFMENSIGPKRV